MLRNTSSFINSFISTRQSSLTKKIHSSCLLLLQMPYNNKDSNQQRRQVPACRSAATLAGNPATSSRKRAHGTSPSILSNPQPSTTTVDSAAFLPTNSKRALSTSECSYGPAAKKNDDESSSSATDAGSVHSSSYTSFLSKVDLASSNGKDVITISSEEARALVKEITFGIPSSALTDLGSSRELVSSIIKKNQKSDDGTTAGNDFGNNINHQNDKIDVSLPSTNRYSPSKDRHAAVSTSSSVVPNEKEKSLYTPKEFQTEKEKKAHQLQVLRKIDKELEPFLSLEYEKWPAARLVQRLYTIEKRLKVRENEIRKLELEAKAELERTKEKGILRVESIEKDSDNLSLKKNKRRKKVNGKPFDFSKFKTRFIALKFAYFGWNYSGLALQNHDENTVEQELLNTMKMLKLIPHYDDLDELKFSRCGRTDKGVSAFNQVIALKVRSALKTDEAIQDPANDDLELNYAEKLNVQLPPDIRVKAVCLHLPENFDARFDCEYRHYKYLFKLKSAKYNNNVPPLDIEAMKAAASKFVGNHDFRNFCKIDGSKQITNHYRTILDADILKVENKYKVRKDQYAKEKNLEMSVASSVENDANNAETDDDAFYVFDLKGKGFLWHQVRCMVVILFLIGGGHEKSSVINFLFNEDEDGNALLDNKFPNKPIYDIASDIPLVLYDCKYPSSMNLKWRELEYMDRKFIDSFSKSQVQHEIMSMFANNSVFTRKPKDMNPGKTYITIGDARGRIAKKYIPLKDRPTVDSVESVNAKFRERKEIKIMEKAKIAAEATKDKEPGKKLSEKVATKVDNVDSIVMGDVDGSGIEAVIEVEDTQAETGTLSKAT